MGIIYFLVKWFREMSEKSGETGETLVKKIDKRDWLISLSLMYKMCWNLIV